MINSWSVNTTVSNWGKLIAAEQQRMVQFLPGSLLKMKAGFVDLRADIGLQADDNLTLSLKCAERGTLQFPDI